MAAASKKKPKAPREFKFSDPRGFTPLKIKVFKNGDQFDSGLDIPINKTHSKNWTALLDLLGTRTKSMKAITKVYTVTGKEIKDCSQLTDGGEYVAVYDKFKKAKYRTKGSALNPRVREVTSGQKKNGLMTRKASFDSIPGEPEKPQIPKLLVRSNSISTTQPDLEGSKIPRLRGDTAKTPDIDFDKSPRPRTAEESESGDEADDEERSESEDEEEEKEKKKEAESEKGSTEEDEIEEDLLRPVDRLDLEASQISTCRTEMGADESEDENENKHLHPVDRLDLEASQISTCRSYMESQNGEESDDD